MIEVDFGYVNARVRSRRRYLLKKNDYEELLKVGKQDIENIAQNLSKTLYDKQIKRNFLRKLDPAETLVKALFLTFRDNAKGIQKILGKGMDGYIIRLLHRWDLINIKIALRLIDGKLPIEERRTITKHCNHCLPVGDLESEDLIKLFTSSSVYDIETILKAKNSPYAKVLAKYHNEKSILVISNALDRYYFSEFLTYLKRCDEQAESLILAIREQIDFENILLLLRWERTKSRESVSDIPIEDMLIPGGQRYSIITLKEVIKSESDDRINSLVTKMYKGMKDTRQIFSDFKPEVEDYEMLLEKEFLLRQLKRSRKDTDSFNVVISYYYSLLVEIRNLRTIIIGLQAGIDSAVLESRLILM